MTQESRQVVLKVGKIDLRRFGFDPKFQALLRQELPKHFPIGLGLKPGPLVLTLVRAGASNIHWILKEEHLTEFFVKVSFGRGSGPSRDRLVGQDRARIRFQKTQAHQVIYEVVDIFSCDDRWITVEAQNFIKDGMSLDDLLKESFLSLPGQLTSLDFLTMGQNIAHSVHRVHSFQPSGEMIGTEEYQRFLSPTQRDEMYTETLKDILNRAKVYMPVGNTLLSKQERSRLLQGIERFSETWTGKGDRLCLVHGDLQRGNIFMPDHPIGPGVLLIDFSPRVQLGEPRWDDGRFVADMLHTYLKTGDGRVKALIDGFVVASEVLSGDKLYRQGLVWGVFAMTLLNFWAKGRPINDPGVAQMYLDHSLKMIEEGCFSWPS